MRTNKSRPGLADLKRLRRQAEQQAIQKKSAASVQAAQSALSAQTVKAPSAYDAPLSKQDLALLRQAMKSVQRIAPAERLILSPRPEASIQELRLRRERATGETALQSTPLSLHYAPAGLDHDDSRFLKPGVGPDILRDLKRGKWLASASLDLHGATQDQAWERLSGFLKSCVEHQIRCVRIVHGKGYGSRDGKAVLKQTVRRWLAQWPAVQAYVECAERDGGSGAVQVLLTLAARP